MHETLSSNFKGYIDNFHTENGNLRVSGWLTTEHDRDNVIYFLDIGHNVAFYNYNERQDVANFYKTNDQKYLNCGFDISIPAPNVEQVTLFALVSGQKEVIFSLNRKEPKVLIETKLVDETFNVSINKKVIPEIVSLDNFYDDPMKVREIALQQNFTPDLRYHKGQRTNKKFIAEGTKQVFESLLGAKITRWVDFEYNGIFQFCTAEDLLVYHSDVQSYAGAIYLTPNAPVQTGTSFYRSRKFPDKRRCHVSDPMYDDVFEKNYYDKTRFEMVDTVGNVFNRLVLWDASLIHSATEYFGTSKENARLFHLFFFDIDK